MLKGLCAAAALLVSVRGIDWPEFRGPTGQGHSSERNLPLRWSATENVAWKQDIPGRGWSSPVVAKGRVYLTTAVSQRGGNYSLRALALEARTGKITWNREVFLERAGHSPHIHSKNSHASPTPIVRGNRLFVHFGHEGTACLDALDGKVIWRNDQLYYEPVHGGGGSPVLVEGALVFSCDGARDPFLAALEAKDGRLRWRVPRRTDASRTFSFSTPLVVTVDGQKQVISPGSNMVGAYDPKDGREIWRVRYEGYSVVPRPVFGNGLLFVCTGFDRPTLMAIRPGGQGDVTSSRVVWTIRRGAPNTPSPLLIDNRLYFLADSGIFSCAEAATGKILWQERIGGNCSASPIEGDGKIYLQTEEGAGVVLEAGKTFKKLAANRLEERSLASPAISDGALFIRTERRLYKISEF